MPNGKGGGREYIWITRWQEFQHYAPRRDRGPAWIKDYTAQLDDERYLRLTDTQRALLHDLRLMFALYRGWVSLDLKMINARAGLSAKMATLEALNQAGFVQFISREALEARLEKLYASRAPARSQEEETERDEETERTSSATETMPNEARPQAAKNGHDEHGLEQTHPYLALLHAACGANDEALEKLQRAARGKPEAAIVHALESCTGPGVRDPLAVALAELAKAGKRREADFASEATP